MYLYMHTHIAAQCMHFYNFNINALYYAMRITHNKLCTHGLLALVIYRNEKTIANLKSKVSTATAT